MNLNSCLSLALDASEKASKAILDSKSNLKIWQKEDKTKVSSADMASNEILTQMLSSSGIKVFSEEKILHYEERKNLEYFWLIDPLDGTSGFLEGSDEFCIMISLIYQNRPILALIKNPSNGEVFYAHKDTKVYKNDKILEKNEDFFLANKNTALLGKNYPNKDKTFLKNHELKTLNIGSGLKFNALLEGKAGVYRRVENLSIWDIAAGDFLVNQNGGFMGDFNQNPLLYNQKNLKASSFIAVADKNFLSDFI